MNPLYLNNRPIDGSRLDHLWGFGHSEQASDQGREDALGRDGLQHRMTEHNIPADWFPQHVLDAMERSNQDDEAILDLLLKIAGVAKAAKVEYDTIHPGEVYGVVRGYTMRCGVLGMTTGAASEAITEHFRKMHEEFDKSDPHSCLRVTNCDKIYDELRQNGVHPLEITMNQEVYIDMTMAQLGVMVALKKSSGLSLPELLEEFNTGHEQLFERGEVDMAFFRMKMQEKLGELYPDSAMGLILGAARKEKPLSELLQSKLGSANFQLTSGESLFTQQHPREYYSLRIPGPPEWSLLFSIQRVINFHFHERTLNLLDLYKYFRRAPGSTPWACLSIPQAAHAVRQWGQDAGLPVQLGVLRPDHAASNDEPRDFVQIQSLDGADITVGETTLWVMEAAQVVLHDQVSFRGIVSRDTDFHPSMIKSLDNDQTQSYVDRIATLDKELEWRGVAIYDLDNKSLADLLKLRTRARRKMLNQRFSHPVKPRISEVRVDDHVFEAQGGKEDMAEQDDAQTESTDVNDIDQALAGLKAQSKDQLHPIVRQNLQARIDRLQADRDRAVALTEDAAPVVPPPSHRGPSDMTETEEDREIRIRKRKEFDREVNEWWDTCGYEKEPR